MSEVFLLEELRELLQRAAQADRYLKQFGASTHKYQWNSPASQEDVEAFEQEIGVKLPDEYRKFLLQAGNGGAGPYYGLFSLDKVRSWLTWDIQPQREPWLHPGIKVPENSREFEVWEDAILEACLRGCIPIGSQGDSYFMYLLVTGPHRGRVVYIEDGMSYVFFTREQGFLAWYKRWLGEIINGYDIFWFGMDLDGDEETLRQCYLEAETEEDRKLVLLSMRKFPSLSEEAATWIKKAAWDYVEAPDIRWLLKLLNRVHWQEGEKLMEKRWEAGKYDGIVLEIHYMIHFLKKPEQTVLEHWGRRILYSMPKIEQGRWYIALELLTKCSWLKLSDVTMLWSIADPNTKQELIRAFGRFTDAEEHLDIFLKFLEERRDLKLLNAVLMAVPIVKSKVLFETVDNIIKEFTYNLDTLPAAYSQEDKDTQIQWKGDAQRVCQTADIILERVREAFINPKIEGIPHPHRILMQVGDRHRLEIGKVHGKDAIAVHPLIGLVILEMIGRLSFEKEELEQVFAEIKTLTLKPRERYIRSGRDWLYMVPPEVRCTLPKPYYYDLTDWSVIGRMKNLCRLDIEEICVDDFSFLAQCKSLTDLSLYNTNFMDCRILGDMPKLKKVDLRLCQLEYQEILANLKLEVIL